MGKLQNLKISVHILGLIMVLCLLLVVQQETDTIKIATKPMTEQFILSEMLALLIEKKQGWNEITKGIGGVQVIYTQQLLMVSLTYILNIRQQAGLWF